MSPLTELNLNTLSASTHDKSSAAFNFKDMKRNSLKVVKNTLNLEFKREKSVFPNVFLPSGSFTRESSSYTLILKQIRELFQLPVPSVYLGSTICARELDEFYGIYLEFSLRNLIIYDLNSEVEWDRVTGRLGKSNEFKEKIGFDLEKELKTLKKPKELQNKFHDNQDEKAAVDDAISLEILKESGKLSQLKEQEWAGPVQLKELIRYKKWLRAGIYSKDYVLLQLDLLKEENQNKSGEFKFPLPIEKGEILLSKDKEFDLDARLELFYDLTRGKYTKKTPFVKIKSNIYLDRKMKKAENYPVCKCSKPLNEGEMGCGDGCLNRVMMFECLPGLCNLGEQCGNQGSKLKAMDEDLEVVEAPGRGFGLVTKVGISKDKFIMEYCGEVLSQETTLERMNTVYKDMKHYYFLDYSKGEVVDGCLKGTIARFINHSCEPNCRIEKWTVGGEYRIGVYAERDIKEGEELTYNYRFESFGLEQKCKCGSSLCTGVMGNLKKEEDKSLKKLRKTNLFSGFYSPLYSDFWTKKNGKEYLDNLFKDLLKLDYYYYYMRIFLLRNIKTCYMLFKTRHPGSTGQVRGTSSRRFSTLESKSVSKEIKARRKRPLASIIEDLWSKEQPSLCMRLECKINSTL